MCLPLVYDQTQSFMLLRANIREIINLIKKKEVGVERRKISYLNKELSLLSVYRDNNPYGIYVGQVRIKKKSSYDQDNRRNLVYNHFCCEEMNHPHIKKAF